MGGAKSNGFVKIHRRMLESDVWALPPGQRCVWFAILMKANWEARTWLGESVDRGEFITSNQNLASLSGVDRNTVRRALKSLTKCGAIDTRATQRCTRIRVLNFDRYQVHGEEGDPNSTQTRPNAAPDDAPDHAAVDAPQRRREEEKKKEERTYGAPKRAHQLPSDWTPTAKHQSLANERGLDLEAEVEKFRLHAEATGRTMKRWGAAFSMWLCKSSEFGAGPRRTVRALPNGERAVSPQEIMQMAMEAEGDGI